MSKKEPETIEQYKKWLSGRLCEYVKKIELAAAGDGITKDFIYKSDIIKILNGREYEAFEAPLKEYDIVKKYFDSINIEYDKKDKHHSIKCFNILNSKTIVSHNFYENIIFPFKKSILVLGHINGQPYEYRYYYKDLYHLERILKETFIQNCLYAKYDKQPILKLKGDKSK